MAVTGTQLYDKGQGGQFIQIYPNTDASVVTCPISAPNNTVENEINNIYDKLSELQGDKELTSSIIIDIKYCLSTSGDINDVPSLTDWSDIFQIPTYEFPYTWKKTVFTYTGENQQDQELKTAYEVCAVNLFEETQTIYAASSTTNVPKIEYPIIKDGYGDPVLDEDGNEQEDLTAFDDKLPTGWSEIPISVSSTTPNVYMSTRKRVDGLWERFTDPVQFGRWAFDSQLELRYQITSDATEPPLDRASESPAGWSVSTNTDFTGYLWMITATSVNGVLNATYEGQDKIIWRGPNLISIVK